jgi:hypothetical protein
MFERTSYSINNQPLNYSDPIGISCGIFSLNEIKVPKADLYMITIICEFMNPCLVGIYIDQTENFIYGTENYVDLRGNNLSDQSNSSKPLDLGLASHYLFINQVLYLEPTDSLNIKYLSDLPNKVINTDNRIIISKL